MRREEKSFTDSVLEQSEYIKRVCRYRERDPVQFEELYQEVMFKAFKSEKTYKEGSQIKAWLSRIIISVHIDLKRKENARFIVGKIEHSELTYEGQKLRTNNEAESNLRSEEIKNVLNSNFGKDYLQIIELRSKGYDWKEVGILMNENPNKLKSIWFRGKNKASRLIFSNKANYLNWKK